MQLFKVNVLISGDVQISVIYGQDPSHQCLHNNDDVTLTCTVNPLNDRVKWLNETTSIGRCSKYGTCFHDGGIDTMKYTFSFSSPGEFRLRINPISPATDAGVYKCEHEGVSASVTLDACGRFPCIFFTYL